jgi:gas vesicle protein
MVKDTNRADDQGSFLTGFTLGIFAGAIGYYFFGTQKGKRMRTELSHEWQQARQQIGPDKFPHTSLRDFFTAIVKSIQTESISKKTSSLTKKTAKNSGLKSKFKGT